MTQGLAGWSRRIGERGTWRPYKTLEWCQRVRPECGFNYYLIQIDWRIGHIADGAPPASRSTIRSRTITSPIISRTPSIQDEMALSDRWHLTVGGRYDSLRRRVRFDPIPGMQIYACLWLGFNSNFGSGPCGNRKPKDALGAPQPDEVPARIGGVLAILLVLAALLPLLAASLAALWLLERLLRLTAEHDPDKVRIGGASRTRHYARATATGPSRTKCGRRPARL